MVHPSNSNGYDGENGDEFARLRMSANSARTGGPMFINIFAIVFCCMYLIMLSITYSKGTQTAQSPEQCNTSRMQKHVLVMIISISTSLVCQIFSFMVGCLTEWMKRYARNLGFVLSIGNVFVQIMGSLADFTSFIVCVNLTIAFLSSSCNESSNMYASLKKFLMLYWILIFIFLVCVCALFYLTCYVITSVVMLIGLSNIVNQRDDDGESLLGM